MGTRNSPGIFNCYAAALPDEEVFTVLGRDPATPATIRFWAEERQRLGKVVTTDDQQRIREALVVADRAEDWRAQMIEAAGDGDPVWRLPRPEGLDDRPAIRVTPELRWGETDDDDGKLVQPLSASRICELLDYATCYGEFDENTPNGTISKYGESMSSPMNDIRRHAIWIYKQVLGLLPEGATPPPVDTRSDYDRRAAAIGEMQAMGAPARDWLTRNGFENVKSFMELATTEQVAAWEAFSKPDLYRAVAERLQDPDAPERAEIKRFIGKSPALGEPYSPEKAKPPVVDSAPEDLAHAPEVPYHRFSAFHVTGAYAYARGLEVSPPHLPTALDAMAKSGWDLVAIFGQTDAQHIGFIFRRYIPTAFELAHGIGGSFDATGLGRTMTGPVEWPENFTGSDALDTERYRKD